jgi:hypothetical protein
MANIGYPRRGLRDAMKKTYGGESNHSHPLETQKLDLYIFTANGLIEPPPSDQKFPRDMALLCYTFNKKSKRHRKHEKHAHDTYVESFLSRNGGKIDTRLYEFMLKLSAKMDKQGMVDECYYFENASEYELAEFARNDPWVTAGDIVLDTKITPVITVIDPYSEYENIDEDIPLWRLFLHGFKYLKRRESD